MLGEELSEALVGLPAEVKVVGSETEHVVPLEELAMRTLHRIYHRRPTGEETVFTLKLENTCWLLIKKLQTLTAPFLFTAVFRAQLAASHHPPKEPAGSVAVPPRSLSPMQPSHVHNHLPQTLPPP